MSTKLVLVLLLNIAKPRFLLTLHFHLQRAIKPRRRRRIRTSLPMKNSLHVTKIIIKITTAPRIMSPTWSATILSQTPTFTFLPSVKGNATACFVTSRQCWSLDLARVRWHQVLYLWNFLVPDKKKEGSVDTQGLGDPCTGDNQVMDWLLVLVNRLPRIGTISGREATVETRRISMKVYHDFTSRYDYLLSRE